MSEATKLVVGTALVTFILGGWLAAVLVLG